MGLMGLLMAYYGGLEGILSGLAKSTDHPSIWSRSARGHYPRPDAADGTKRKLNLRSFELCLPAGCLPPHGNPMYGLKRRSQKGSLIRERPSFVCISYDPRVSLIGKQHARQQQRTTATCIHELDNEGAGRPMIVWRNEK